MKKVTLRQETSDEPVPDTERLRFGDRLRLEFAIEERALEALVASLLLQPLIGKCREIRGIASEKAAPSRVEGRARGVMLELR